MDDVGLKEEFARLHWLYGPRAFRKPEFYAMNVQLFHYAQVLCTMHAPRIQAELDQVRKDIMEMLVEQMIERLQLSDAILAPAPIVQRQRWTWLDYQITPEVSHDPNMTGLVCSRTLTLQLKSALAHQVKAVKQIVGI